MGGTQRSNVRNARGDQLSQIFSVTFQRKHKKQRLPRKISERKLKRRLKKTAVGKRENSRPLESRISPPTCIYGSASRPVSNHIEPQHLNLVYSEAV